jgi:threonine dehydratase
LSRPTNTSDSDEALDLLRLPSDSSSKCGIRRTTIIEARRLGKWLGVNLILARETFQHSGSFKFRAAHSVASRVPQQLLITASSGNFGQALAVLGNSTLGTELSALKPVPEFVVVPVGGGGLSSGIIFGVEHARKKIQVIGAEPLLGNDAARSLKAGRLLRNESEPQTIADGARTMSLGEHNWRIIKRGLKRIVEVPEERIAEAVRLLFGFANLKAEPTGALSVAAVMTKPDLFRDRLVCCVISGGNVDPEVYKNILSG